MQLTAEGRAVAARAAADLGAFFGPGWAAPAPFLELVALWARLRLLVEANVQGIAKLRGNLARNPSPDEFRHGILQARLAAQGLLAGERPVLEPPVGDVLIGSLLLELRGLNPGGPDALRRFVRAVELKAKQTRTAPAVWVWIEDGGALGADFAAEPLERVFNAWPHLLGVVLTRSLAAPAATATEPSGRGARFVRTLPGGVVRESVVVHRPGAQPAGFAMVCRLCRDEPAWLDAALARLGFPGGLAALFEAEKDEFPSYRDVRRGCGP
ncbi:hypothetical protein [Dactylosporangium sp. CA-139066]|uniref:hypothetical protein n=1 Tax=Dactylosporangium sp. CA-139066 TaxID=3239930 RepID=UPI003D9284AD